MGIVTPSNIELEGVFHIDNMDDLARIGTYRLEHDILGLNQLPIIIVVLWLRRIVLYDVEHFLAVKTASLVWVRCFAELALQVFPKVRRYYVRNFHNTLVAEPSLKTSMVDVPHRTGTFAGGEQWIIHLTFLHEANTADGKIALTGPACTFQVVEVFL